MEEAKARAELEIVALKKAHERRLIEIQLTTARSRNRVIAALLALLFTATAATSALFYFGRWRPEAARTEFLLAELRSARTRTEEAERLSRASQRRYADLVSEVERLRRSAVSRPATPTR
jgi:hypothetical protein